MNFLENKAIKIAIKELDSLHEESGKIRHLLSDACDNNINTKATIDGVLERLDAMENKQMGELHSWLHALKDNNTNNR